MSRLVTAAGAALLVMVVATSIAAGGSNSMNKQAPRNMSSPLLSGVAQVPNTLTANTGSWQGKALKYGYQWLRCNSTGASCAAVSGATAKTYGLSSPDVTDTVRVIVTATNHYGTAAATSEPSAVVTQAAAAPPPPPPPPLNVAPSNTEAPTVDGTPQQGLTLTGSAGSWSGTTPMTYAYQWQRCDSTGGACAAIAGATAATYVPVAADVGRRLRVSVTASNVAGSTTAASVATATVSQPSPPPPPPPTFCNGCYVYAPLDGAMDSPPWTYLNQGVNGGAAPTPGRQWITDGVQGGALRLADNADSQLAPSCSGGTCAHLSSEYITYGSPLIGVDPGDSTWYRVHVRFPTGWRPYPGSWNWLVEWHNGSKAAGSSVSFAIGATANSDGTGARLLIRPGGGLATSPQYKWSYAPAGSLQTNHWYDLVIHVVWSTSAADGRVEFWIDGTPFSANGSEGPNGTAWSNPVSFPTLYSFSDGTHDAPAFGVYNYHPYVTWEYDVDYDEISVGPSAASVGFAP